MSVSRFKISLEPILRKVPEFDFSVFLVFVIHHLRFDSWNSA